nr:transglycosylase domain-containing protein [Corynebacterium freiburgense]
MSIIGALSMTPLAGVSSVVLTRTQEAMESNLADLTDGTTPTVTTILDAHEQPMAWLYTQRRFEVPSEQISEPMKQAIVSIEDHRFYEHDGVDWQGTIRATLTNLFSGSVEQGASTLDQQYVKNYLLLVNAKTEAEQIAATETSYARKLREMKMASDLEKILSKDEILARYLNIVPFGNGAFGVEAAARTYFDIPASELNVPQAAMLAGIVQSSSFLNPYTNPEGVTERRNTVLDTMVRTGVLTQADAEKYQQEPLGVLEQPKTLPNGCIAAGDRGFFCDYVIQYLAGKGISVDDLSKGGYTVYTTLDPDIQDAAHQAVVNQADPMAVGVANVMNVVEPGQDSRKILAMTSSRNYGLNLEAGETVLPQTSTRVGNGAGSVFKIFTAAVALEKGLGVETPLAVPPRYEARGLGSGGAKNCPAGTYCVENSGAYKPTMTLKEALAQSPNTTFVKLIEEVGVKDVVDMSVKLGLRSYEDEGSFDGENSIAGYMRDNNLGSYTLGPTAINPLELSNVAATLASHGRWCEPNPVDRIVDRTGNEVPIERPECEEAVSPEIANALSLALSDDTKTGTAAPAASAFGWGIPTAAKTGTTESHQSSAFLGYNSTFAAAAYAYNDGTNITPLCTSPLRQCGHGDLYGGMETARTWLSVASATPAAYEGNLAPIDDRYTQGLAAAALPSVTGLTESAARKRLEQDGYSVATTKVPGNGVPSGRVIAVVPDGSMLQGSKKVTLQVSDGTGGPPQPNQQDIDNAVNEISDVIQQLIDEASRL